LIEAVKDRNTPAVLTLLKNKADVNAASADGATPLHWAAELDEVDTARALIHAGANVKATNRYGITPLTLACTNGSGAMVDLLLTAGADPNTTTPEGETALMTAARTGRLAAVNALLSRGAEVNKKEGWQGQTALMWAAAEGHSGVVARLLEAGADPNVRSSGGFTALLFAVRDGKADVVRTLLKAGGDVNELLPPQVRRSTGATEFTNIQGGSSALNLAVANGHFELASILLNAGADPNAAAQGWTPLHTITWVRKPGTGSNDPAPAGSGNMDSLQMVRELVKHGADVNARMTKKANAGLHALNSIGATPFLMAARTADAELMRLLAELGADPLLPNADKTTPLMVAAGVGTRSPGEDAGAEPEVLEAVKVAIELGNDINAVDANGETAMHGAAYKHLPAVAQYLAEHGAKAAVWNQKNKSGWTPLRIAEGVHRTGNLRSSAETAEAIRKAMIAQGLKPVADSAIIAGNTPDSH
jgi:ankyrin repeat protein